MHIFGPKHLLVIKDEVGNAKYNVAMIFFKMAVGNEMMIPRKFDVLLFMKLHFIF